MTSDNLFIMHTKSIYINGLGNVSPQNTTNPDDFLDEPLSYETNLLKCLDPGYKEFIPSDMLRRMGRIIKMGVAASKICLRNAGQSLPDGTFIAPDAIITGTGMGCLEDTGKFLTSMINNQEELLTPTSFIQSTHNTVAGQIALLIKCYGYNFTYVHRGFSFESALMDAIIQIKTGEVSNVLAGASDEITSHSFAIMERMGHWKQKPFHSLNLLKDTQRGTIAGEGASFFFLENQKKQHTYAELKGITTLLTPASVAEAGQKCAQFLAKHELTFHDIDLLVPGFNGDIRFDTVYNEFIADCFPATPLACFKHLCGEYHTATAFALWLASLVIEKQRVPAVALYRGEPSLPINNVLIYNHYRNIEHAFILVSKA